jgi:hypothetical protein
MSIRGAAGTMIEPLPTLGHDIVSSLIQDRNVKAYELPGGGRE